MAQCWEEQPSPLRAVQPWEGPGQAGGRTGWLKFIKGECRVLHMGEEQPQAAAQAGADCREAALRRRTRAPGGKWAVPEPPVPWGQWHPGCLGKRSASRARR